jgi:hypothetical protein
VAENNNRAFIDQESDSQINSSFDYSYVHTRARIAVYDDLLSAPRIITIEPGPITQYLGELASKIFELAQAAGGKIPYTVILEISENFIHAQFEEIIVSILDEGNTIRFADQGPGIKEKDKAQLPGFSSATEPMKKYIRGIGSGFAIAKEYLNISHGTIVIEDNLNQGAVVTISLKPHTDKEIKPGQPKETISPSLIPPLNEREISILKLFSSEGALGVTDITNLMDIAASSTYVTLKKLEEAGLIEMTVGKKRILTDLGYNVVSTLKN